VVEPAPQISRRRDDVTPDIDRVIAKGMAKDPRERFATPTQLIRAAAPALGVKTPAVALPAPRKQQPRRHRTARRSAPKPRRRLALGQVRAPAWVALALFVSALAGFATGNLDPSSGPSTPAATPTAPAIPAAEHRAVREQRTQYVVAVGRTMNRLDRRRARARHTLRRARRARNQAAAAQALVTAFAKARESLPSPATGLTGGDLSSSLREAERAYRELAVAARKGNDRAWRAARRDAVQRERNVARVLERLRSRYDELERRSAAPTRA
jgi:hypothetical protein